MFNVLIVGYGSIGKRYHEAILQTGLKVNIIIKEKKKIKTINSISKFKGKNLDLVIVSTNADVRLKEVQKIIQRFNVKSWILEKNLGQSFKQIDKLKYILNKNKKVWLTTNYKTMSCFKKLKKELFNKKNVIINIIGTDWGLCCNSMHFIDTFKWIFSEKVKSISTKKLNKFWVNSKRKNFYEAYGTLNVKYETCEINLISLKLKNNKYNNKIVYKIIGKKIISQYFHESGLYIKKKQKKYFGKIEPISQNMIKNIKNILINKECDLYSFNECFEVHKLYLSSLYEHWKKYGKRNFKGVVPIA